jgi:hypothetical protein
MNPAIKENTYTLLAFFLSPWKKTDDVKTLRKLISKEVIPWEQLLFQANRNLCTPLWYVCLKNDNLLKFIPDELQLYLQALYEANLERNTLLVEALFELQEKFNENNIPFILLKGGAAIWDNLYDDPGARLLQDLDLLVKPGNAEHAWQILEETGYEEIPEPEMEFDGLPTDSRHHHLNAQRKPDTPVVIEIHYRTGYAKAGELLLSHEAWGNTVAVLHSGARLQILDPTLRLIHNTAHGLIPQAEFIKGTVSLQQLAEFAFITSKYRSHILWHEWLARGKKKGFGTEFLTYLALGQQSMCMEFPSVFKPSWISKLHAARISAAGKYLLIYKYLPESSLQQVRNGLMRVMLRSYYLLKLPFWVWQNVCYTERGGDTLLRIKYLFRKAFNSRSRAKI